MYSSICRRTIEWGDCDPAGIVFNPRFFEWFDAATATLLSRALGLPTAEMLRRYDIIGIPLVATSATFHAPCSYGDEVRIESEVAAIRSSSFGVRHRLVRADGVTAVEGAETRVWTARRPDRPTGIGARPIPDDVRASLSGSASGDGR